MTAGNDEAESYAQTGRRQYQAGEYEAAARAFGQAERRYREGDDPGMAAEMANNRAVALLQLSRHGEALDALAGTPELFERADEPGRAAQAFGNLATALEGLGRLDEAETAFRRALELFEATGDAENRAHTAKAFSRLLLRRGHTLEAVTAMQQGLAATPDLSLRDRLLRWLLQLPARFLGG